MSVRVPSMSVGVDQLVPLKIVAYPDRSTATQKVAWVQETALRFRVPSIADALDHTVPLQAVALPEPSTATQNVLLVQLVAVMAWPLSTATGAFQA